MNAANVKLRMMIFSTLTEFFSHCLICGYLTLDHVCDDDELEKVYSSQEENEENEYQCCDDEIEF